MKSGLRAGRTTAPARLSDTRSCPSATLGDGNPYLQTLQVGLHNDLTTQARIRLTVRRKFKQGIFAFAWLGDAPEPSLAQIDVAGSAGQLPATIRINTVNSSLYRSFHDGRAVIDGNVSFISCRINKSHPSHHTSVLRQVQAACLCSFSSIRTICSRCSRGVPSNSALVRALL